MRIALLFNADAGDGLDLVEIRREIAAAGHELVAEISRNGGGFARARAAAGSVELFVVAGGDGTIADAAIALAGSGVPMAMLAVGTANNIARSLDVPRAVGAAVHGWRKQRRRALDLASVRGPFGERVCLEGVGCGLIPVATVAAEAASAARTGGGATSTVPRALAVYRDTLAALAPRHVQLSLDGERLDLDLLLLEVLNISRVGPGLRIAPDADPGDGLLDVVIADESRRAALERYLRDRHEGRAGELSLPRRRAHRVEIDGWRTLHVDDRIYGTESDQVVSISLVPGAVEVMC